MNILQTGFVKMKMRGVVVTASSFALTFGVIANAFWQKKQFYPSVVYITKSSPCMAVLYMQAFVMVALTWKIMRKIFFGQLRAAETEHLIERSWYAITETCLAFTVFRDDFSPHFVGLFTLLLFIKGFHWLTDDRIDYMERSPLISVVFHLRALAIMSLLAAIDSYFIHHAYAMTLTKGASVQLVFGFEYSILLTMVFQTLIKYVLHSIDLRTENPWEKKAVYLLYTELVIGAIKVALYLVFLVIMIKVHTFPLFAIRPMYLAVRSFRKAFNDVILSRRAIHNMNTLYPDATPEDLAQGDNVCIICREEMTENCKKLPCNHIFHRSCLRSWFQRQQTCPTCRMDILRQLRPTPEVQRPPPAAAPPPPQQQNPFFPPPGMPGFPPMWMPPPPPPPPGGAPAQPPASAPPAAGAPPGAGPSAPASSAIPAATSAAPTSAAGMQPPFPGGFMPPMFGGMGMFPPGMMPPYGPGGMMTPPMPANLQNLSAEELAAMEGQERQSVARRVECLQNIRTLLDASFMQIQQYYALVQADSNMQRPIVTQVAAPSPPTSVNWRPQSSQSTTAVTSATHTSPSPQEAPSQHTPASSAVSTVPSKTSESNQGQAASPVTFSNDEGAVGGDASAELMPKWTDSKEEEAGEGTDLTEVRRRRIEKLSSTNLTQLEQDAGGSEDKTTEKESGE